VGDGDAMGVTSQITQDMLGASEGWLGIDDQFWRKRGRKKARKALSFSSGWRVPAKVS